VAEGKVAMSPQDGKSLVIEALSVFAKIINKTTPDFIRNF
jgi:hypothetical protein